MRNESINACAQTVIQTMQADDFKTNAGKQPGVKLTRRAPEVGDLEVYFDAAVSVDEKIIFSKYLHEHLLHHAKDVVRLRHYVCTHCGTPVGNHEVLMKSKKRGARPVPVAPAGVLPTGSRRRTLNQTV